MSRQIRDHAVVLGASMAGLAAARVLADAYERVTVLERDALPAGAAHRKGVPQSRHAHALLAGGRVALEQLFPGLTDELVANGALTGDLQADTRWYNRGLRLYPAPSDLRALAVSRPLLEQCVRDRVRALGNVRLIDCCDAAGLAATPDGQRVRGVRIVRRADGSAEEILEADLVLDATGRARAARSGWSSSATRGPPRTRCASGSPMPAGSTGAAPTSSTATGPR